MAKKTKSNTKRILEPELFDLLTALVEKSLVELAVDDDRVVRYTLNESTRQYAHEKLDDLDETLETRRRHGSHYVTYTEDARLAMGGIDQVRLLNAIVLDRSNITSALDFLIVNAPVAGLRLAAALQHFWLARGYLQEGSDRMGLALSMAGEEAPAEKIADALNGAGMLAMEMGRTEEVQKSFDKSLEIYSSLGNARRAGQVLGNMASLSERNGDYPSAIKLFQRTLCIAKEEGDRRSEAVTYGNLGILFGETGHESIAKRYHEDSLAISRDLGDDRGVCMCLHNLGNLFLRLQQPDEARRFLVESMELARRSGDRLGITKLLHSLGDLAILEFHPDRSLVLYGAAEALRDATGESMPWSSQYHRDHIMNAARLVFGGDNVQAFLDRGRQMSVEEAIAFSLRVGQEPD